MNITRASILLLGAFFFHGCSKDTVTPTGPDNPDTVVTKPPVGDTVMARLSKPDAKGTFTDTRDGKTYPWVQIGYYQYMAANLAYEPKHGKTYIHTEPGLDSATSLARYGRSYDYEAMMDSTSYSDTGDLFQHGYQGACPEGWILPTTGIFQLLVARGNRNWPGGNEGYTNTIIDSIFMDWATVEEEGGSNSLGLSFRKTYGTDLVCDSTAFSGPANCTIKDDWAIVYAGSDTALGQSILNTAAMGEGARYNNYNVYRFRSIIPGREAYWNVSYTSTSFRRKFSDFSAIRCIRFVEN